MKNYSYLFRFFIWLLCAFAFSRCVFIFGSFQRFSGLPPGSILLSFYYGLKTDISAASYILLFPLLTFLLAAIIDLNIWPRIRQAFAFLSILVNAMVTSADPWIYRDWGVKANYRALLYLRHPSEVFNTATTWLLLLFLTGTLLQLGLFVYLYRRFVMPAELRNGGNRFVIFLGTALLIPLAVLGIRGGIKQLPVQGSDSYYSSNPNLNWAAVNSLWNLGESLMAGRKYGAGNPYIFYTKQDAEKVVDDLYSSRGDSGVSILTNKRPNIVLIIFEGWSADLISSISADKTHSCAPRFDEMAANGVLFTNCIASGERSDQGLAAILSSFPSLPLSSIVNYPEKVDQMPSILEPFKNSGYSSCFLFGGQLSYGNIRALIYHNGFDKVTEEKDIDPEIYRGRLGVHDEHTFDILYHQLNQLKPPFFGGFFTQSTHFSYDHPGPKRSVTFAGGENDYAEALMYADSCLGDFFAKAKKEPWYANTLFVMVSDHSHVLPWNEDHKKAAMHHIPLLFYGDVIRNEFRGMRKNEVTSQQDICATLLAQLGFDHTAFKWSRDALTGREDHFAYWTFTEGFGFTKSDSCEWIYDIAAKRTISPPPMSCDSAVLHRQAFSYLQMIFDDLASDKGYMRR